MMKKLLLAAILFLGAAPCWAAITHDADSNSGNCGDVGTCSWTHVVGTSASDLWVGFSYSTGFNGPTVTSVKIGTTSLTLVQSQQQSNFEKVFLYHLFSPPVGSATITVLLSTNIGTAGSFWGAAVSFLGSDTSALDNTGATTTASAISVSLNLTTANNNAWIIDAKVRGGLNIADTANVPQATVYDEPTGNFSECFGMSYHGPISPAASTSDGWTMGSSTGNWALVSASIKPGALPATGAGIGGKAAVGGKSGLG